VPTVSPTTWTGSPSKPSKEEEKRDVDEWGNVLIRDKNGNIIGAIVPEVGGWTSGARYEGYRAAKMDIEGTEAGAAAIEFRAKLTGEEGPTEAAGPTLPEDVPPFVTEEWFQMLTGSVQTDLIRDWREERGFAIGGGAAPPLLSPQEERTLIDLEKAIKVGEMDEDQAWNILEQYWNRETVQTLLPALPGIPLSQLRQPSEAFAGAQQQMGLPGQLPPISPPDIQLPNWQALGQAMPSFGGTNYFEQLLREGRSTAPPL